MKSILSIQCLALVLFLAITANGCFPPPQQQGPSQGNVHQQEGKEPDYTNVDRGLNDESPVVREQAVQILTTITHSSAIEKLVKAVKENSENDNITKQAVPALIKFQQKAINPVKNELWDSEIYSVQRQGFLVLKEITKPENFYSEAQDRFYNSEIQYSEDQKIVDYKLEMLQYLLGKADIEDENTIPDIVAMLQLPDKRVVVKAEAFLSQIQDQRIFEPLERLFYMKKDDPQTVAAILKVMNSFKEPGPKANNENIVKDLTMYLEAFGSYDRKVQTESYNGLKKFGYNDPDGKIVAYISKFKNSDNDLVRSHVVDLMQALPNKQYPQHLTPPTFEIPVRR